MDEAEASKKLAAKQKRAAAAKPFQDSSKQSTPQNDDLPSDIDDSEVGEDDEDGFEESEGSDEAAAADSAQETAEAEAADSAPLSKRPKRAGSGGDTAVAVGKGGPAAAAELVGAKAATAKVAVAAAVVAPFAGPDPWVVHLCRLLSEEELGSVQARMTGVSVACPLGIVYSFLFPWPFHPGWGSMISACPPLSFASGLFICVLTVRNSPDSHNRLRTPTRL